MIEEEVVTPGFVPKPRRKREPTGEAESLPDTVIGWQGVSFILPPEWNLTSFSMDRENGYLRADSPGDGSLSVQIRWQDAVQATRKIRTVYDLAVPHVRKFFKRPDPEVGKLDLKAMLDKFLKPSAKDAKRIKSDFECTTRPEKLEGLNNEREAVSFSYTGSGKGQGKIWRCRVCNRILVAQIIGASRDTRAIQEIASRVLATLKCHSDGENELWALYDLQIDISKKYRLTSQKVMSGNLQLVFMHGGEMIRVERWGLANMVLKKFTIQEWLAANRFIRNGKSMVNEIILGNGHAGVNTSYRILIGDRIKLFKKARGLARPLARHYEGGMWLCAEEQKIFMIELMTYKKSDEAWRNTANTLVCHRAISV